MFPPRGLLSPATNVSSIEMTASKWPTSNKRQCWTEPPDMGRSLQRKYFLKLPKFHKGSYLSSPSITPFLPTFLRQSSLVWTLQLMLSHHPPPLKWLYISCDKSITVLLHIDYSSVCYIATWILTTTIHKHVQTSKKNINFWHPFLYIITNKSFHLYCFISFYFPNSVQHKQI